MIYVRVELWPFGQKEKARVIGEMTVGNIGGTDELGTGVIIGHDRSQSIWALIRKALACMNLAACVNVVLYDRMSKGARL